MSQAGATQTPLPTDTATLPGTLRADMEKRRERGERYSTREVVAILIPVCTELIGRHKDGQTLVVTPSSIRFEPGSQASWIAAQQSSTTTRDRACLAPESRSGKGGDSRTTVFSIGAIAYEMLTGETVGPGMRRPSELVDGLPPSLDIILSKALIGSADHRPADLAALAQAIHAIAPAASMAPPAADMTSLDIEEDFDVIVSMSMLPPPPPGPQAAIPRPAPPPRIIAADEDSLITVAVADGPPAFDPTSALARLRDRLEADSRPRYVVIKDGMDHGPFSAVELLQQIASHTFEGPHILLDTVSQDERPISKWEEFAPFAEHALIHRQIAAENKEIEMSVAAESKTTRTKALLISAILVVGIGLGLGVYLLAKPQRTRADGVIADGPSAINIEFDGNIKSSNTGPGGGRVSRGVGADGVSRPVLAGGMSCEGAMNTYVTELSMGGNKPDLTSGQLGKSLNNGSYVVGCGAPMSMTVNICAAIQNGKAVGVTVTTDPPNAGIASCISSAVRRMSFPSHPALDVTRTTFAGQ